MFTDGLFLLFVSYLHCAKILVWLSFKIPDKILLISQWGQILGNCPGRHINICAEDSSQTCRQSEWDLGSGPHFFKKCLATQRCNTATWTSSPFCGVALPHKALRSKFHSKRGKQVKCLTKITLLWLLEIQERDKIQTWRPSPHQKN